MHSSRLRGRAGFGDTNKDLSVNDGEMNEVSYEWCVVICNIFFFLKFPYGTVKGSTEYSIFYAC